MQKRKGISLIVLVITIIIMIILAGSIILTLSNNGIIGKASEAVEKSDEANIKSILQTYWAEAYIEALEDDGKVTEKELQDSVKSKIFENNLDTKGCELKVTLNGVDLITGWKQEGLTVRKGDKVLNIGDKFVYDETPDNDSTITVSKDVEWKVLGASDDGELLIMSTSDIDTVILGVTSEILVKLGVEDWLNGISQLDDICVPYSHGKSATGARSIRIEDVDKITGYDPKEAEYRKGEINEYGNEVTYSYAGEGKIKYYSANTKKEEIVDCKQFYYLDKANKLVKADLKNGTGIITTIKSDHYSYDSSEIKTIKNGDNAYVMLFGENGNAWYWLASQWIYNYDNARGIFGISKVREETVNGYSFSLWVTDGDTFENTAGVRAVVSLSPDIQVGEFTEAGWIY